MTTRLSLPSCAASRITGRKIKSSSALISISLRRRDESDAPKKKLRENTNVQSTTVKRHMGKFSFFWTNISIFTELRLTCDSIFVWSIKTTMPNCRTKLLPTVKTKLKRPLNQRSQPVLIRSAIWLTIRTSFWALVLTRWPKLMRIPMNRSMENQTVNQ